MKKICIVIPCYNEQFRLPTTEFVNFYNEKRNFHFIFVNDGSKDLTSDVIKKIINGREDRMCLLEICINSGKSEAVRLGMLHSQIWNNFEIVGYLDADLSIPLDEAERLTEFFKNENVYFVFGSRLQRLGVNIKKKLYRHIIGRVFATFASRMLNIVVYDTQCGVKFFKKDIINHIFGEKFNSSWIFDLEVFYRFINYFKGKNLNLFAKEIPLEKCIHVDGSKIRTYQFIKIPIEMIKLYFLYNIKGAKKKNQQD
ncbi:MAG: glycosyltransferase [Flavobacteriaceae bacterium]|nr:glycosyltransferase [Flavobacteriaceae bacterium]